MPDITNYIVESIFPILQREECSRFNVAGSIIFISYKNIDFLVTASHVLSRNGQRYPLYIVIDQELILLTNGFLLTEGTATDLAFLDLSLDEELYNLLKGHKAIVIDTNSVFPNYDRLHYLAFGYPSSQFYYDQLNITFNFKKTFDFIGNESSCSTYNRFSKDSSIYLLVDYIKNKVKSSSGHLLTGVDPYGASGGGIFKLCVDNNKLAAHSLVGILIEWKGKKALVGTRVDVLKIFLDHYLKNGRVFN